MIMLMILTPLRKNENKTGKYLDILKGKLYRGERDMDRGEKDVLVGAV